jgi:hypothetical protein
VNNRTVEQVKEEEAHASALIGGQNQRKNVIKSDYFGEKELTADTFP